MVTGTSFLSQPGFAADVYGWGFIIIIGLMALLGISRKAPLFYLGQAIKLCFVWVPVGFVVMVSIGVLGYVADGWENKMAEHEAREVRLYNGDTTPLPDPDSKYEMN